MGDSGIVFGESEDFGSVGIGPTFHGAGEVPATCRQVCLGIKKVGVSKRAEAGGFSPILGGSGGDLHQTTLPGGSDGAWFKVALPPNHGAEEGEGEVVSVGRLGDEGLELLGAVKLPHPGEGDEKQRGKNEKEGG